jgi:hypothetical protein
MSVFLVTALAARPAGHPGQCFYCLRALGQPHVSDCVLIVKRVRVRMSIDYERYVPATWDKDMVEFHMNESSWCKSNAIEEIESFNKRLGCLCHIAEFEHLSDESAPILREA